MKTPLIGFLAFMLTLVCVTGHAQTSALKKITLRDKVEILVPEPFKELEEEILKFKYPSASRPTLVYSDDEAKTNVAFNFTQNKASQPEMEAVRKSMEASFRKSFPTATWLGTGVKVVNGRNVGFVEIVTPAMDQKIYNLLFFSDVEGKLLMGTFNCLEKERTEWQATAHQIMNSLTLKK